MKLDKACGVVLAAALLASIFGIEGSNEFQIATGETDQEWPAIYGNIVVWDDHRNGHWDIYGYDLSTQEEFRITTNTNDQFWPTIYGDIVVWTDERNGNRDIYGYRFSTREEFPVTIALNGQSDPAIYGDIVVWVDERDGNWDIYGYNLSTEQEFQITVDPSDQEGPAIYENIVVWTDNRNGNEDIYGYNLSTEQEFQITEDTNDQESPAIYGNIVVWTDNRNGNEDIYGYDLSREEEFQITTDESDQEGQAIQGNIVVWEDFRNGNWDIYGYNLSTGQEFQITVDPNDQEGPAIYENIAVWHDNRNGYRDIYRHDFLTGEESLIAAGRSNQWRPAIYGDIVVWTDNRNGNEDIYGYNLSRKEEFEIATDPRNQSDSAIYGDIVVWTDNRKGNKDIYRYNLTVREEVPTTTDRSSQLWPEIHENIIVWVDNRKGNRDIYGYDLSKEQEFQITEDPNDQSWPAIYRDIVVWADYRNGNWDIYGYDLSTEQEFQITEDTNNQESPVIYGNIVLWTDNRNGNRDIYGYYLLAQKEFEITINSSDQYDPAIYGDNVVWVDERNDKDIYGCNLSTILDNDGDGYSPALDCDDHNPAVYPGAEEICDGRDNNCDDRVDEGFDKDEDGYTTCGGDCKDYDDVVYPGAEEICDGRDNNCDGKVDEVNEENVCGSVGIGIGPDRLCGLTCKVGEEKDIYFEVTLHSDASGVMIIITEHLPGEDPCEIHRDNYDLEDDDGKKTCKNHINYLIKDSAGKVILQIKAMAIVNGRIVEIGPSDCEFPVVTDGNGIPLPYILGGFFLLFLIPLIVLSRRFKSITNPYIVGPPIKSKNMFFGREDAFRFIKNKLSAVERNIAIVLHGERRTGKTSILLQIKNGRLGKNFVPVYIDLQEMAGVNDREFCAKVTDKIMESLVTSKVVEPKSHDYSEIHEIIKKYKPELNPYNVFTDFLDKASDVLEKKYLLVMFDEYERLWEKVKSKDLSPDLIQYLRYQMQFRERFAFIFTGSRKLKELKGTDWSVMFNVAIYKRISFLERGDALALMNDPVKNKIHYDGEAMDKLLRLTAYHPYFLQLFLQNLVDLVNDNRNYHVTVEEITHVLDYILRNPQSHMSYVWDDSTPEQRMVLSALSEIIESEDQYVTAKEIRKKLLENEVILSEKTIEKACDGLANKEILSRKRRKAAYYFKIDLFRFWIENEYPVFKFKEEKE